MLDGGKLALGRKRNMKNKDIKEMFSSVVTEVLEEELGISKEAYDEAVRIYNVINALIMTESEYGYYFIDREKVYGIKREGYIEIFNQKYTINYNFEFIFVDNAEMYGKLNDSIQLEYTGYDQNSNILFIRIPILTPSYFNSKAEIIKMDNKTASDLYNTLQHEFKHIYQKYMLSQKDEKRQLLDFKKSKVYHKATLWIFQNGYDNSDLSKMFWAIYQLTSEEITANIQGLYGEIKKNAKNRGDAIDILSNSEFVEEMQVYSNLLDKLNNNKVKLSDLMVIQKRLGRNTKWLIKYINKGVNKMKQSVRKLEKLIDKEYIR